MYLPVYNNPLSAHGNLDKVVIAKRSCSVSHGITCLELTCVRKYIHYRNYDDVIDQYHVSLMLGGLPIDYHRHHVLL